MGHSSLSGHPTDASHRSSTTASATSAAASVDTTSPPVTFQRVFTNVQAIASPSHHLMPGQALIDICVQMSSICSALLMLALVLGIMACRTKARRDREMAHKR